MDLSNAGKDGKSATLGEVMKQVMAKYKVKIDASANQRTRQTTFHVKAESQKELDKAKRSLLALLSPVVRLFPSNGFTRLRRVNRLATFSTPPSRPLVLSLVSRVIIVSHHFAIRRLDLASYRF
jgi:hypothetical protein